MHTLVNDLLLILTAGLIAGLVCRWLQISVLVGYLIAGVLIGGGCLHWVSHGNYELESVAEVGVFLLLFSIGLELSLDELWHSRRQLIVGGFVQMGLSGLAAAWLLIHFEMPWRPAVLVASAVAFSSTVLVFKALSEWDQSRRPHGRRAIAILLFQDVALVPLLLVVPLMTGTESEASVGPLRFAILGVTATLFVGAIVALRSILAKRVIPMMAGYRSPELVVLFTICSLGGVAWAAHRIGLPAAIGAFAAGLIFNGNRWTHQIEALVLPFRETFAAVFFVGLGLLLDPAVIIDEPLLMLGLLAGLIVTKALAAMIALRLTGLNWTSSAGMSIGLAHIGEFSFVVMTLARQSGVVGDLAYQRVVALAIGSLVLTPVLLKFGLRWTRDDEQDSAVPDAKKRAMQIGLQSIVVGAGPIGRQVTSRLEMLGSDVCLIDLSPLNLFEFTQAGFRTIVGDATDADTLRLAQIDTAQSVVICVPDDGQAVHVVQSVRTLNKQCHVIVRCRYQTVAKDLSRAGANEIVSEETQASDAILRLLS